MTLVSIIIAVYNGEEFIKDTLESLLNQTYQNIEIIIIVNCSNDETLNIISTYDDERIKVYETNICQLAFNLNYGLYKARGKYIARIDADDIAEENRIEKQLNILEKGGYDVVGSNLKYIDENGKEIGVHTYPELNEDIRKQIVFSSPIAHPSVMYKKSVVLNNNGYLNGKVSEDYDLWLRLMRDKKIKFYNIQEQLIKYRIHSNQAKGNKLAYYEVTGYMLREAFYQKSFQYFIGFLIYLLKSIFK